MPRLPQSDSEIDAFYAVLAQRPEIFAAWKNLDAVLLLDPSSTLPTGLKEEVRASLAQGVGCRFCASVGGPPAGDTTDRRASLASAFADQVVANRGNVDDAMFDVLREEFTDTELVELCTWICFKFGSNVMGALMKLEPATDEQADAYRSLLATATH